MLDNPLYPCPSATTRISIFHPPRPFLTPFHSKKYLPIHYWIPIFDVKESLPWHRNVPSQNWVYLHNAYYDWSDFVEGKREGELKRVSGYTSSSRTPHWNHLGSKTDIDRRDASKVCGSADGSPQENGTRSVPLKVGWWRLRYYRTQNLGGVPAVGIGLGFLGPSPLLGSPPRTATHPD